MAKEKGLRIQYIIPILNSFFKAAKADVQIVEFSCYKEQVVIGYPQIESLESELKLVDTVDDCEPGARYIAFATLISSSRTVSIYVRFYLGLEGKLRMEDFGDNGVTLVDAEEIKNKSGLWKKVIDYVVPWGPVIIKMILTYFGNVPANSS